MVTNSGECFRVIPSCFSELEVVLEGIFLVGNRLHARANNMSACVGNLQTLAVVQDLGA